MTKDEIKERIKDFFSETSRLTLALLAILVFFILSATVLLFVNVAKNKKKPVRQLPPVEFTKDDEFIAPKSSSLTEDYYFSRNAKEVWTKEEASQWFTEPAASSMQELRKDNTSVVEDILGAAP